MMEVSTRELESYPGPVQQLFRQVDGYLDLGMTEEAHARLDRLGEKYLQGPLHEELLLRLSMAEADWRAAADTAERLLGGYPEHVDFWIAYAYASRRGYGIEKAQRILVEARRRFPDQPILPYNLACYACVQGDHEGALALLRPLVHHQNLLDMALEDEDLEPLWPHLESGHLA